MRTPCVTILAAVASVSLAAHAHGYAVSVPVMNEPGLEKFGGREKVLGELRSLGASRIILCLGRYECDAARRSAALQALRENGDWFKSRGLETCAWTWAFWGKEGEWPSYSRITEGSGKPSPFFCPLDDDFRAFAAQYAADIAESGVGMVLYDDDYGFRNMSASSRIACLCPKLPAYVNGNPDLYLMVKRDAETTIVGLWNIFADSVLDGVVELDCQVGDVEFFNCTGRVQGDKVIIDGIPPFAFVGIKIGNVSAK